MKKETTEGCGSKGYEQQFDRQKESLGAVVGGAEKDVKEEARQAVKEVKARAREHIRRTRDYADKARKMGCGCASDARKQARRVKEEIREEVREAKKTIKGRVERFRTGEDAILSDIENQPTCRPDLASIASHMESDGDYRATDDRGDEEQLHAARDGTYRRYEGAYPAGCGRFGRRHAAQGERSLLGALIPGKENRTGPR